MSRNFTTTEILSCLDYTDLTDPHSKQAALALCQNAVNEEEKVAALCVWPEFVTHVSDFCLKNNIELATVVNFPKGEKSLAEIDKEIYAALKEGVTEIDAVIPYKTIISGKSQDITEFVRHLKSRLPSSVPLKLILETGAFEDKTLLRKMCDQAIAAGANMLKTSTGKTKKGASLEAVKIMAQAIKDSGKKIGIKVSGGVKTKAQAEDYMNICADILGQDFINPLTFRIGTSSLLATLLKKAA